MSNIGRLNFPTVWSTYVLDLPVIQALFAYAFLPEVGRKISLVNAPVLLKVNIFIRFLNRFRKQNFPLVSVNLWPPKYASAGFSCNIPQE